MTIAQPHSKLGHCNEDDATHSSKATKQLGWEFKPGTLEPCKACATGKAKQKNVPQVNTGTEEGKSCVYLDIITANRHEEGKPKASKLNWSIMVNKRTQLKFLIFYNTLRKEWSSSQHVNNFIDGKIMVLQSNI